MALASSRGQIFVTGESETSNYKLHFVDYTGIPSCLYNQVTSFAVVTISIVCFNSEDSKDLVTRMRRREFHDHLTTYVATEV